MAQKENNRTSKRKSTAETLVVAKRILNNSGRLGSTSFRTVPLAPALVTLNNSRLYWTLPESVEAETSAEGLLDAFLRIKNGYDVQEFASRFGVFAFCHTHSLPLGHYAHWFLE